MDVGKTRRWRTERLTSDATNMMGSVSRAQVKARVFRERFGLGAGATVVVMATKVRARSGFSDELSRLRSQSLSF